MFFMDCLININHRLYSQDLIHDENVWNRDFNDRNFHVFYKIRLNFSFTVLDNFFHTFFFHSFSNDFVTVLDVFFDFYHSFIEYSVFHSLFDSFD